ncbi:MAG: hypothetical protein GX075_05275 [Firmicutes bacterium]|nr:hypothetical protein [Bacillota bacterium]
MKIPTEIAKPIYGKIIQKPHQPSVKYKDAPIIKPMIIGAANIISLKSK